MISDFLLLNPTVQMMFSVYKCCKVILVLIRKLCHTKYMNHSAKFWNCVREYISDYKKRKQLLKEYSVIMDVLR